MSIKIEWETNEWVNGYYEHTLSRAILWTTESGQASDREVEMKLSE